jgi:hypothetical protein
VGSETDGSADRQADEHHDLDLPAMHGDEAACREALAHLNGIGRRVFSRVWDRAFAAGELVSARKSCTDSQQVWFRKPID